MGAKGVRAVAARGFGLTAAVVVVLALSACEPNGITLTVNDPGDNPDASPGDGVCEVNPGAGDCTLRAAIDEANALGDHERIVIADGIDITLTSAQPLVITDSVTIDGGGATIDAAGATRAIDVTPGATRPWINLRDLEITGGAADHGAALAVNGPATVALRATTMHTNTATGHGGAIWAGPDTTVSLTTSTLSTNTASGTGGAIASAGTVSLTYSTVTANTTANGGAIDHHPDATGTARAMATIIADQTTGADCTTPLTSANHNIESTDTCGFTNPGDHQHTTAHLGPMADNGGPTPTHHMTLFSALFDTIGGDCDTIIAVDQRSYPRRQGNGCDPGAIERLDVPEPPGDTVGFGNGRNHLGTHTLLSGAAREELMLSVSGYCARREHGDRITPAAAANHWPSGPFTDCAGTDGNTIPNPEHDPAGYFYAIVLDHRTDSTEPWGHNVAIEVYDAPHCQGTGSSIDSGGASSTRPTRNATTATSCATTTAPTPAPQRSCTTRSSPPPTAPP